MPAGLGWNPSPRRAVKVVAKKSGILVFVVSARLQRDVVAECSAYLHSAVVKLSEQICQLKFFTICFLFNFEVRKRMIYVVLFRAPTA